MAPDLCRVRRSVESTESAGRCAATHADRYRSAVLDDHQLTDDLDLHVEFTAEVELVEATAEHAAEWMEMVDVRYGLDSVDSSYCPTADGGQH